mmetsp:Transcript_2924/g.6102  ORF Transcript_2924/g.6102 Transcript_2924/m.6102 type:complete len:346 (+) Transcript_2924:40-1077(+)
MTFQVLQLVLVLLLSATPEVLNFANFGSCVGKTLGEGRINVSRGRTAGELSAEAATAADRRIFLHQTRAFFSIVVPCASVRAETRTVSPPDVAVVIRPSAPKEALLPAVRCRIWIVRARDAATPLSADSADGVGDTAARRRNALENLNRILLEGPRPFPGSDDAATGGGFVAAIAGQIATGEGGKKMQSSPGPSGGVAGLLNRADAERQWGILRFAEMKREGENEIRRAFNFYTSRLQFDPNSYVLTAEPGVKSKMIREDRLPTTAATVVSDLDLRDLYRNQVLTGMDDVKAEVKYQLEQKEKDVVDVGEVVDLLEETYRACERWFELVPPKDIREAMDIVVRER